MKLLLSIILLFSFHTHVAAQLPTLDKKRANIWYFGRATQQGYGAPGLDFSSGQPVVLTDGVNVSSAACTISDADGNLQMYSATIFVANALHDSMTNSIGITNSSAFSGQPQGHLFIPNPSNNGLIYLFTFTETSPNSPRSYVYHVIDMNLSGGLGEVVSQNNHLHIPTTAKQTAVHHSNCRDVWVVSHPASSNNFYAYLVTDTGVNTNPVISSAGAVIGVNNGFTGTMKLSPNGKKIAFVTKTMRIVQLFDFDNSIGIVSNAITLPVDSPSSQHDLSFSPDGTKLYVCTVAGGGLPNRIHQFDVSSGDSATIVNSRILIGQSILGAPYGLYGMHLAPDGKMYISKSSSQSVIDSLAIIHNPNAAGLACNFELHAIRLYGQSGTGLNNLIQSYFNEAPDAYPCFVGMENRHLTISNNDSVVIYPNPFYDKVKIELSNPVKNCRITIHDLSGREFFAANKEVLTDMEIERKNMLQGVYILKIQGENFLHSAKIIIIN